MLPILLDTNILVYAFELRDPERQSHAENLILRVESEGVGRLSVQCLGEFFRVVTQKLYLHPAEIFIQVERLRDAFPVFNLTPQIVLEAARGVRDHRMAYYDAQIWATARLDQIPVIFSENFQDGQVLEGVRFANPFAGIFDLETWF
jgi:predicted nucleic acid-binding protein